MFEFMETQGFHYVRGGLLHIAAILTSCFLFLFYLQQAYAIPFSARTVQGAVESGSLVQTYQRLEGAIHNQVAATQTTFQFQNTLSEDVEVQCRLAMSSDALVDGFSYWNGDERIVGEVLEKAAATTVYQELTGMQRDPGILEQTGSTFRFSVYPVKPGETKPIEVRTTEVLQRAEGKISYRIPHENLPTGDVLLSLSFDITDDLPIENVETNGFNGTVRSLGPRHKKIVFEGKSSELSTDLQINYSLKADDHALRFVSYRDTDGDGSFMLLVSPKDHVTQDEVIGRDIVFVTDISGSMTGQALAQSKLGLSSILEKLQPEDHFNVIAFDDEAVPFYANLLPASDENRANANTRIAALKTRGGTNIKDALLTALNILEKSPNPERPKAVIFLTDGQGNNPAEVVLSEVRKKTRSVRIYSFGAGRGINRQFLERLARDNRGIATFIANDNQIEREMARLYDRISMPLMVDLELDIEGAQVHSIYPKRLPDLYRDGEVIVFGRYTNPGTAKIRVRGLVKGESKELNMDVTLPDHSDDYAHIEKLWANDRIDHLKELHQARGATELVSEITRLGIVYNLVTPYTTFLAVPESLKTDEIKEAIRRGRQGFDKKLIDTMKGIRLSQANIPPGDPVLTVVAPEDARKVVAYFPFGLVKRLQYDDIRNRWSVRFLVPRWVTDGVYNIRVQIVHSNGRMEWKSIEYTIDGTEPEFEAILPEYVEPGQRITIEVDPLEQVRTVEAYVIEDPRHSIRLTLDTETGLYSGELELPEEYELESLTIRIVVRDRARNRHEQDHEVILAITEEGCETTPPTTPVAPQTAALGSARSRSQDAEWFYGWTGCAWSNETDMEYCST